MADDSGNPPAAGGSSEAALVLASLGELSDQPISGVLLIEQRRDDPPELSQLMATTAANDALSAVVKAATGRYLESDVIEYNSAASTSDGQVMWIAIDSVPMLKDIVDQSSDLAAVPLFDPATSSLNRLRLAAMRVDGESASVVFVQSLGGSQVVARSRSKLGFFVRRGTIDVPDDGQVLLFNKDVAAVVVGDIAFFSNRASFQRLFGFLEELKEKAAETFAAITADLRIAGIEQMAVAVTSTTNMLGKMASIQNKVATIPQYRDSLTMPKLVAFIDDHPECEVEVIGEGDAAQLVFSQDYQHRFKILKLLDDDYLRSELTDLEYDANSKSAPIQSP
jgi:hypothetical protein